LINVENPFYFFPDSFWFMENKAQVSVELIVLLAAVVAVALVLVSQLQKTGKKGAEVIDKKTEKIFDEIADIK